MKIISIDPGYDRLGIAVIERYENKAEKLLFSECFQTSSKLDFKERLLLVGNEVEDIIKKHIPQALSIEKLFFNTNQKTAINVAQVIGVIVYIAKKYKLDVYEYTPLQIKSAVAGNGRGSKKDVINMVHHLIKIDKKIQHDDEYDAIAAGITCFASERF